MWANRKPSGVESNKDAFFTLIRYSDKTPPLSDLVQRKVIKIVSIDPAQLNLALRIEKRDICRDKVGSVETLVFIKKSVVPKGYRKEKGKKREISDIDEVFYNTTSYLNQYFGLLVEADVVLIESQMTFNIRSSRVMQHMLTYFSTIFSIYPCSHYRYLVELNSKAKTKYLPAPRNMSEQQVKDWSIIYGQLLLQKRGDFKALEKLKELGTKQDDLTDTCVQAEALMVYLGVPIMDIPLDIVTSSVIPGIFLSKTNSMLTRKEITERVYFMKPENTNTSAGQSLQKLKDFLNKN